MGRIIASEMWGAHSVSGGLVFGRAYYRNFTVYIRSNDSVDVKYSRAQYITFISSLHSGHVTLRACPALTTILSRHFLQ